jgi:type II secretory pathway predicted ATPase ExeA
MLADVQFSYGLAHPFHEAGNFETEHQRNLVREVCAAVQTGRLIVSGLVGSGKTHLLRRIEDELVRAGKVAVAKSLAVDKRRTSLPSLIEALFYDLSPGDRAQVKIPKQAERRERDLRDIIRKGKRPVVLVVDEAHDLHHKTLTGLKRLMEVVADAGVLLSVLLVGHPRLRNDLRRP